MYGVWKSPHRNLISLQCTITCGCVGDGCVTHPQKLQVFLIPYGSSHSSLKRLYRARGNIKDVASCKPSLFDLSVENEYASCAGTLVHSFSIRGNAKQGHNMVRTLSNDIRKHVFRTFWQLGCFTAH